MGDQITTGESPEAVEKYSEGIEAVESWKETPEKATPKETGGRELTPEEAADHDIFVQIHGQDEPGGPGRLRADLDAVDAAAGVKKPE